MEEARFGPAGQSLSFSEKYKNMFDIPTHTAEHGLNAFEYQCGRGVRVSQASAEKLGKLAAEKGIELSLHAPYYISLSGLEEKTRMGSIRYVLESAAAVKAMGKRRVILHSGSCGKQTREQALELAKSTLKSCLDALDEQGFGDITLCPETMGKINQLGSLDEVMELCSIDERLIPCIDFGHLNARTLGGISSKEHYAQILDTVSDRLGSDRLKHFHAHFSKIEYTTGGEKRHLTFTDTQFGPEPIPLLELIVERELFPTVICESDGTQAEDASFMRRQYIELREKIGR